MSLHFEVDIPKVVSSSTGLVAGHAYPVLQCCLEEGQRLLYVKNPWGHTRWKGRYAPGDLVWTSNPILASKLGYNSQAAASIDDGAFWIPWEEVLRYFSHFYISWSPSALGLTQLQAHGCWNPWPHFVQSILPDDTDLLAFNPQFHLQLLEPLPSNDAIGIWVVLSRHIKSPTDYNSHFVSVSIYNGKSRICCPNSVLEQGVFSNGECALVKLRNDASGSQQDFTVVVSQHGAKRAFNYTVQVYTRRCLLCCKTYLLWFPTPMPLELYVENGLGEPLGDAATVFGHSSRTPSGASLCPLRACRSSSFSWNVKMFQ